LAEKIPTAQILMQFYTVSWFYDILTTNLYISYGHSAQHPPPYLLPWTNMIEYCVLVRKHEPIVCCCRRTRGGRTWRRRRTEERSPCRRHTNSSALPLHSNLRRIIIQQMCV